MLRGKSWGEKKTSPRYFDGAFEALWIETTISPMSTRVLVTTGAGAAIRPMISGVGFVAQTTGGTATSPINTFPSSPRFEFVCRGEHPIAESNSAHNAPHSRATRSRIRRSRDGQSAVNIRPSARR
jgi:hypothetical protein